MSSSEENLREEVKILRTQVRSLETEMSSLLSSINSQLDKVEQNIVQSSPNVDYSEDNYEKKSRAISHIAGLLGGQIKSDKNDKYSLKLRNGERIKIKFSEGGFADQKKGRSTKVWAWTGLGEWQSSYDRLILIGETDPEFKLQYKDPKSAYILFVIPASRLNEVLQGKTRISLNVNRKTANTSTAFLLFDRFQTTIQELRGSSK